MNTEVEAKFTQINHDLIRNKLKDLKAELMEPMRLMKRVIFESPCLDTKNAFVRVRDEGNKTTVTYKQFDSLSLEGAKEIGIEVSNFDAAVALLNAAGLNHSSLQESKRETWKLGNVEIVLDIWPWLDPYIEIEGPTQESVMKVAGNLNLEWDEAVFGDVMAAYRIQYPHLGPSDTVANIPEVRFGDPLPSLLSK